MAVNSIFSIGLFWGITATLCVKDRSTDIYVSGSILTGGAWEYGIVNNVVKLMEQFGDATFLDIGANLGMYAVTVSAMKRQVVAVDGDPVNVAFIHKSASMSNTTDYIRIVYNSVR